MCLERKFKLQFVFLTIVFSNIFTCGIFLLSSGYFKTSPRASYEFFGYGEETEHFSHNYSRESVEVLQLTVQYDDTQLTEKVLSSVTVQMSFDEKQLNNSQNVTAEDIEELSAEQSNEGHVSCCISLKTFEF